MTERPGRAQYELLVKLDRWEASDPDGAVRLVRWRLKQLAAGGVEVAAQWQYLRERLHEREYRAPRPELLGR